MGLCIMCVLSLPGQIVVPREGERAFGADGYRDRLTQKYPGFPDRVHEGLQDIFGEKGR